MARARYSLARGGDAERERLDQHPLVRPEHADDFERAAAVDRRSHSGSQELAQLIEPARRQRSRHAARSYALYLRFEPDDELALAALPRHEDRAPEALQERDDTGIVPADRGDELCYAGSARVGREHPREGGSHSATLLVIGDREGDLGRHTVTDEACDPDRPGVSVDVADEDVVIAVDAREGCEPGSERRGFPPQKRRSRERSPRRANRAATVSVSPLRRDLIVSPFT